jgi:integration host factor subunit alpha
MSDTSRAERTLTRQDLRKAVYKACPTLSLPDARAVVDATIEEISEALLHGETVKLSSFGVFKILSKRERIGRNPKTRDEAVITARRVVTFRPAKTLVAYVNGRKGKAKRDAKPV